jgi:hypothetical protein
MLISEPKIHLPRFLLKIISLNLLRFYKKISVKLEHWLRALALQDLKLREIFEKCFFRKILFLNLNFHENPKYKLVKMFKKIKYQTLKPMSRMHFL